MAGIGPSACREPADSDSQAHWRLWYADVFDRETPRQIQASGLGLSAGLAELWLYHLYDGVSPDGRPTFSRYNLWLVDARQSVEISEDRAATSRLRSWVLGGERLGREASLAAGDPALLQQIAVTHSRLLVTGWAPDAASAALLAQASAAEGPEDLRRRLAALAAGELPAAPTT